MTREEVTEKLTSLWYFLVNNDYPQKDLDALKVAIKALEQEPKQYFPDDVLNCWIGAEVLDKIRAEIDEQYDRVHPYDISCAEGLEMALGIIDKYKAESEEG